MEALKAFLTALKMSFKVVDTEYIEGEITNPETIRRIEAYENGLTQPETHTLEEIKALIGA